jgi:hypothetical protein
MNRQLDGLDAGDQAPTEPMMKAWSWACADLRTAVTNWNHLNGVELAAFNGVLTKSGHQAVRAPGAGLVAPVCSAGTARH